MQDHYECAVHLIARGARLDIANSAGQLARDCLGEEKGRAAGLIQLGTTLQVNIIASSSPCVS